MKIVSITASRLINTGNYENTKFEATAALNDGEDAQSAMQELQKGLVAMIRNELVRRFPDPGNRRYVMWVEEDERAQP